MELVPPRCHRRNAVEVAICNFKAHFLSVLAGVSDDFPPSLWDQLLPQTKSHSISFNNLMPPLMCWHTPTSVNHLTKTKCHSPQWAATCRCMRKPTNTAHGHFICWMNGIYLHHPNTIAHTIAMLNTQRANAHPTLCNSNTNASLIPPSHTWTT